MCAVGFSPMANAPGYVDVPPAGWFSQALRPCVSRRDAGVPREGVPGYDPRTPCRGVKPSQKPLEPTPNPETAPSPWGKKYLAFLSTLPISIVYEQRTGLSRQDRSPFAAVPEWGRRARPGGCDEGPPSGRWGRNPGRGAARCRTAGRTRNGPVSPTIVRGGDREHYRVEPLVALAQARTRRGLPRARSMGPSRGESEVGALFVSS